MVIDSFNSCDLLGFGTYISFLLLGLDRSTQRDHSINCYDLYVLAVRRDRVIRYDRLACKDYVEELQAAGLEISMSRKGNPYDNAAAESFMKTLKYEEVYLWDYQTVEDVKNRIPYFLEEVYNQKRLHSALAYCPPNEYEKLKISQNERTSSFVLSGNQYWIPAGRSTRPQRCRFAKLATQYMFVSAVDVSKN